MVKINQNIYFIFLLIILILCIIYYVYITLKKDNFERVFPPYDMQDSIVEISFDTPISPLQAPLKEFERGKNLPSLYIYNPSFLCEVRNQKNCGACWAFVITSMISDKITVRIEKFGKQLSVQELLTCYPNTQGCQGAEPEAVLKWLADTDFKLSISDEYTPVDNGECKRFADSGIGIIKNSVLSLCKYTELESSITLVDNEILLNNIYNMKMEIKNRGPIYSTISVYDDFFNFSGDEIYIKKSNEFLGGHAVEIIGWCDKGVDLRDGFNKYGYWVCKNSWGTNWAHKYDFPGYFAIRMGYNECGIESRTGCAEPSVKFKLPDNKISSAIVFDTFEELLDKILARKISKINIIGLD